MTFKVGDRVRLKLGGGLATVMSRYSDGTVGLDLPGKTWARQDDGFAPFYEGNLLPAEEPRPLRVGDRVRDVSGRSPAHRVYIVRELYKSGEVYATTEDEAGWMVYDKAESFAHVDPSHDVAPGAASVAKTAEGSAKASDATTVNVAPQEYFEALTTGRLAPQPVATLPIAARRVYVSGAGPSSSLCGKCYGPASVAYEGLFTREPSRCLREGGCLAEREPRVTARHMGYANDTIERQYFAFGFERVEVGPYPTRDLAVSAWRTALLDKARKEAGK